MPYRDALDTLRERVAWLEGELDRARTERDRVPGLERELADARTRLGDLEGGRPTRAPAKVRWAVALGLAVLVGTVGLLLVVLNGAGHGFPDPAEARESLLPSPALRECLARVPRSPDFQTLSGFAAAEGEIRVTWRLTEGTSSVLRFGLEAKAVGHSLTLGAPLGRIFPRDLSVCRDAPPGHGPCQGYEAAARVQGVVSELSVEDSEGYIHRHTDRWMLVTMPRSLLLLTATDPEGMRDPDRGLCRPKLWSQLLEVPVPSTSTVREEVLVGDPPVKLDCAAADEEDMRCAG